MQFVKDYRSSRHTIILMGPPKSGKSTLAVNLFGRENAIVIAYAVSYTHLRAHETVLDLVCRLLLEKKNPPTPPPPPPTTCTYKYHYVLL